MAKQFSNHSEHFSDCIAPPWELSLRYGVGFFLGNISSEFVNIKCNFFFVFPPHLKMFSWSN